MRVRKTSKGIKNPRKMSGAATKIKKFDRMDHSFSTNYIYPKQGLLVGNSNQKYTKNYIKRSFTPSGYKNSLASTATGFRPQSRLSKESNSPKQAFLTKNPKKNPLRSILGKNISSESYKRRKDHPDVVSLDNIRYDSSLLRDEILQNQQKLSFIKRPNTVLANKNGQQKYFQGDYNSYEKFKFDRMQSHVTYLPSSCVL